MSEGRLILVADDEAAIRDLLRQFLVQEGYRVIEATSGQEVLQRIQADAPELVVMDVRMPELDGLEVLQRLEKQGSRPPVVVMTAHGTSDTAIRAIQLGAYDYVTKPFELDDLLITIQRCFEHEALSTELELLREQVERDPSDRIIGNSSAMQQVYKLIGKVARSEASVLLTGETGTGKELVARSLHFHSNYRHGPWVAVSCASLPETLLESELFGHEKGAFTSALTQRKGRFELANKGTLFLDEVGEISLNTQKKLLRVLQEREFERVGGSTTIKVDVRVIAATNADLQEAVAKKTFREDLFYRLNVINIKLPALRDRREDIPTLVQHFLSKYRIAPTSSPARITEDAIRALQGYHWPGNVRQLENVIQRAVVLSQGDVITRQHLLLEQGAATEFVDIKQKVQARVPLKNVVADVECQMILEALKVAQGNRSRAAQILGIYRRLLYSKMKEYGLEDEMAPSVEDDELAS